MLTVVTTLKSQRRNVLDFMTVATSAARTGKPAPSLLPEVPASSEQVMRGCLIPTSHTRLFTSI